MHGRTDQKTAGSRLGTGGLIWCVFERDQVLALCYFLPHPINGRLLQTEPYEMRQCAFANQFVTVLDPLNQGIHGEAADSDGPVERGQSVVPGASPVLIRTRGIDTSISRSAAARIWESGFDSRCSGFTTSPPQLKRRVPSEWNPP